MNEFTKEELEDIYWHFEYYLECLEPKFGKCKSPRRFNLMNKIQSMIDSYCEHECSEPKLVLIKYCVKCNQHLETRQWGLCDYK